MYVTSRAEGQWMRGVSIYSQVEQMAASGGPRSLQELTEAALADDLRVDLVVTDDQDLPNLEGFYAKRVNALTSTDALALIGLYFREPGAQVPIVGPRQFTIDAHTLGWTAVRSQLPDGWAWGVALIDHDTVANYDATRVRWGRSFTPDEVARNRAGDRRDPVDQ